MNDTTKTLDAMKAELEAAGYRVQSKSMTRILRTIDDALVNSRAPYQAVFTTIESAYEHYQREKKYQAMEVLLGKLMGYETPDDIEGEEDVVITTHFWNWFYNEIEPEAKALLGKE